MNIFNLIRNTVLLVAVVMVLLKLIGTIDLPWLWTLVPFGFFLFIQNTIGYDD